MQLTPIVEEPRKTGSRNRAVATDSAGPPHMLLNSATPNPNSVNSNAVNSTPTKTPASGQPQRGAAQPQLPTNSSPPSQQKPSPSSSVASPPALSLIAKFPPPLLPLNAVGTPNTSAPQKPLTPRQLPSTPLQPPTVVAKAPPSPRVGSLRPSGMNHSPLVSVRGDCLY